VRIAFPKLFNVGETFVQQKTTPAAIQVRIVLRNVYADTLPDKCIQQWIANNRRHMQGKVFAHTRKEEAAWLKIREVLNLPAVEQTECHIGVIRGRTTESASNISKTSGKMLLAQKVASLEKRLERVEQVFCKNSSIYST